MMAGIYTITDDISWAGLRRYHILATDLEQGRRAMEAKIKAENGEILLLQKWHDEKLDNYQLYGAWRFKMLQYPMYCYSIEYGPKRQAKKNRRTALEVIGEALQMAAAKYFHRYERWPNAAVIRNEDLQKLEMYQPAAEIEIPLDMGEAGIIPVSMVPMEINWQKGIVGVFVDPGDGN